MRIKRKEEKGRKKVFAFFHIEIIPSFSSLFSFVPQKPAALPSIFLSGLRLKNHESFLTSNHEKTTDNDLYYSNIIPKKV